jgi:hypothetical protein
MIESQSCWSRTKTPNLCNRSEVNNRSSAQEAAVLFCEEDGVGKDVEGVLKIKLMVRQDLSNHAGLLCMSFAKLLVLPFTLSPHKGGMVNGKPSIMF